MSNIALQAANGQYVCAEGGGGREVVANRGAIDSWETFELKDLGNGKVALTAANGQYVCAEGGGGGKVVANRGAIGSEETFELKDLGNGKVALKAANGQYVCAEGVGGREVVAKRGAIGSGETFSLIKLPEIGTRYYNVTVKTSDKSSAGTDANVYITIWGEEGELVKQQLDKSVYNDFEKNDEDSYLLSITEGSLGQIVGMKLEHDNRGSGPGWHVDWVKIEDFGRNVDGPAISGKTVKYLVNRWLATNEADRKTSVEYGKRPQLSIPRPQYNPVQGCIMDAFIVAKPHEYTWRQTISTKNVMEMSESTSQSNKDSYNIQTNYSHESNVSIPIDSVKVGITNKFSISATYASEIATSLQQSYRVLQENTVNREETHAFKPTSDTDRVGIIRYRMTLRAHSSFQLGWRKFEINYDFIDYERIEVVSLPKNEDCEKFKKDYSQWFSHIPQ